MVLYPLEPRDARSQESPIPAWDAIERTQTREATAWWLIAQPDHAALAGDLASRISSPDFPKLDADVLRAISVHDDGWAQFDAEAKDGSKAGKSNRPLSFLQVSIPDFVRAWRGSIERAEQIAPIAGILVSEHFCRLARARLPSGEPPENYRMIHDFLGGESERQRQLLRKQRHPADEIERLVDVLQFFDLLSLYLCCGSQEDVEFPQEFNSRRIRLLRQGELCRIQPPLFGRGVSLAVEARRYPAIHASHATSIPILLA